LSFVIYMETHYILRAKNIKVFFFYMTLCDLTFQYKENHLRLGQLQLPFYLFYSK